MIWKEHSVLKTETEVTRPEEGTVRLERLMPAGPDRVWQYIVDPALRSTWLAGGTLDNHSGGVIELEFDHSRITSESNPKPEFDDGVPGVQAGTILVFEPPRRLSYTWGEWFGQNAIVTFELEPEGDSTRLVLTHSRVTALNIMPDVAINWTAHLDALEDKLRGGSGVGFWTNLDELREYYEREWA
jgi:uncharacterized protein YndB with AHSA1/START domain